MEKSQLSESDQAVEGFFECDHCRIRGERKSFVMEEKGGHFCLSCWLEKEYHHLNSRPVSAGF